MKTKKRLYYSLIILIGGGVCLFGKIFKEVSKYGWDAPLSESDVRTVNFYTLVALIGLATTLYYSRKAQQEKIEMLKTQKSTRTECYCRNCGLSLSSTCKICPKCGTEL